VVTRTLHWNCFNMNLSPIPRSPRSYVMLVCYFGGGFLLAPRLWYSLLYKGLPESSFPPDCWENWRKVRNLCQINRSAGQN
jgi:hypothetical protein